MRGPLSDFTTSIPFFLAFFFFTSFSSFPLLITYTYILPLPFSLFISSALHTL